MGQFTGKTVLITGASYGLGEGFAEGFAKEGADLILTARTKDLLDVVAEKCRLFGSKVTVIPGDVSIEEDVVRVVSGGIAEHGKIDVLINNAGVVDPRGIAPERFDMTTWNWIISIDLNGAFMYMREVGRHMLERQSGNIVNIGSILGNGANEATVIAYTAAKGALRNLTQQLGCEWADRGVRVNSVSPGFVVTEMTAPMLAAMGIDTWIASRTPMRRIGLLSEIVAPVMFLASDAASYITGHDLLVDGGTNASNGTYQIPPIHHEWNQDTAGRVGKGYPGVQPRPDWYQALELGIPGLHYPLPEA
ncbi:short-chain dehydrogenase [Actinomycetes bacterium]|nr:short-chain dehydrogenase [Actinomycetes bacterium]